MGAFISYGAIICGIGFLMFAISLAEAERDSVQRRAEQLRQDEIDRNSRNIFRG